MYLSIHLQYRPWHLPVSRLNFFHIPPSMHGSFVMSPCFTSPNHEWYMGLSENVVYPMTQWFCWSLSLLNGYFIGGIPHFQTYPYGLLDGYYFGWCPIAPKWDSYQSLNARHVLLLFLLSFSLLCSCSWGPTNDNDHKKMMQLRTNHPSLTTNVGHSW